jgi:hypothetical protein
MTRTRISFEVGRTHSTGTRVKDGGVNPDKQTVDFLSRYTRVCLRESCVVQSSPRNVLSTERAALKQQQGCKISFTVSGN